MATQISDDGASLLVTVDGVSQDIIKSEIRRVKIIKTNIIMLDIGEGALYNVYIPFADVSSPVTANTDALRIAIKGMLSSSAAVGVGGVGYSTDANQTTEIGLLTTLNTTLNNVSAQMIGLTDRTFNEPLLVDDSGPAIIYYGYAVVGAKQDQAVWAIKKVQRIGEVDVTTWANGNVYFANQWTSREILVYA